MKKRITSLMLILVVAVSMTMGASAASYIPDDVTYQNLNGQQLAIKTYTLLPDQDPSDLYEDDFEYDGFLYSMSDIVKEEQRYQEENAHTEVVTVTTASKNLEDILAELKPTIEYDDGVSSGTLSLDHSTLKTEAAGYKRSSYTVTATKNYTGLDRNDSSYIDKTVEKNGRTLSLSNVTWSVESTALVGDELVPATYSAVATYSGSASSTVATGYITTAEYKGTVVSSGISSILYTGTAPAKTQSVAVGAKKADYTQADVMPEPKAGDKIPCSDGYVYEITDVSKYQNSMFAMQETDTLPDPTCDWSLLDQPTLPEPEANHFTSGGKEYMFVRNLFETRRMQYTLYNAIGDNPQTWQNGKPVTRADGSPLVTVKLSIPESVAANSFWPWRSDQIVELFNSCPPGEYAFEAWDVYCDGAFQYTEYYISVK